MKRYKKVWKLEQTQQILRCALLLLLLQWRLRRNWGRSLQHRWCHWGRRRDRWCTKRQPTERTETTIRLARIRRGSASRHASVSEYRDKVIEWIARCSGHDVGGCGCTGEDRGCGEPCGLLRFGGVVEVEEVLGLLASCDGLKSLLSRRIIVVKAMMVIVSACKWRRHNGTHSNPFLGTPSAPIRPRPMKVSAGLW